VLHQDLAPPVHPVRNIKKFVDLRALTTDQRDAPVPHPNVDKLNASAGGNKKEVRSEKALEKGRRVKVERAAQLWLKYAPCYRIAGVQLSELEKRGKNLDDDIDIANATITRMQSWPADACSARLVDDDSGETLVCVFSHRLPNEADVLPMADGPQPMESDTEGKNKVTLRLSPK